MNILTLDVETTGLDLNEDRVIQLAAQIGELGQPPLVSPMVSLFNTDHPISEEAQAVHGITPEMLQGQKRFEDEASILLAAFSMADAVCGYNVTFDLAMLSAEFGRCGMAWPPAGLMVLDVYKIWQDQQPRTLENAYRHYVDEPDTEALHDAGYDIRITREVLNAQIHAVNGWTIQEFVAAHAVKLIDPAGKIILNEDGIAVFSFGKHKGEPVTSQKGYANWMLGADFAESTKNAIRRILDPKGAS